MGEKKHTHLEQPGCSLDADRRRKSKWVCRTRTHHQTSRIPHSTLLWHALQSPLGTHLSTHRPRSIPTLEPLTSCSTNCHRDSPFTIGRVLGWIKRKASFHPNPSLIAKEQTPKGHCWWPIRAIIEQVHGVWSVVEEGGIKSGAVVTWRTWVVH